MGSKFKYYKDHKKYCLLEFQIWRASPRISTCSASKVGGESARTDLASDCSTNSQVTKNIEKCKWKCMIFCHAYYIITTFRNLILLKFNFWFQFSIMKWYILVKHLKTLICYQVKLNFLSKQLRYDGCQADPPSLRRFRARQCRRPSQARLGLRVSGIRLPTKMPRSGRSKLAASRWIRNS